MPELNAISNSFRAVLNGQFLKKLASMLIAHATPSAVVSMTWQMLVELLSAAILGIRVAIDRFVTDPHRVTLQPHPASDLFRRPSGSKAAAHGGHEFGINDQLAMDDTAVVIQVLRIQGMVAVQLRLIIKANRVPLDLAVDCRRIATQPISDF